MMLGAVPSPVALPQPFAAPAENSSLTAVAAAQLTIETGPDTGRAYPLEGGLQIGRAVDNQLILRDPATSGHHARVERRGDQYFVVDLGSTNGTLVNGEPVQERQLKHGDRVIIGQNSVKFIQG
jgi:pSer/pThr/pTyr-binding forkhead associated (FHA) protein